jgi:selenide,water dikinase
MFLPADYPDLLVGLGRADDAAVYRLDYERALVATTDFFTPVVDDPYAYGAIAAANAMSDVYAMGGQVFLTLNIAGFPPTLPPEICAEILRGAAEKVKEAGAVVAGGHTVSDKEPKFGLVAIGMLDPQRVLTKGGAKVGDRLVLTKPIGSGAVTTAFMRDLTTETQLAAATESMLRLNKQASEVAVKAGVLAMTDITGFGLLGHASEMLEGSVAKKEGVGFLLHFDKLPTLPGAKEHGADFVFPGGAHNNRSFFASAMRFEGLEEWEQQLCFSPETSGGLLMAVPVENEQLVLSEVEGAVTVGEVIDAPGILTTR